MAAIPPAVTRVERLQQEARTGFPALWREMLEAWNSPAGKDRLWLMYSASYLLCTAGLRWAIDPVRLCHRLPGAPRLDFVRDLQALSLVVLTHRHGDHLDLELIHSLRALPVTWVVPEALLEPVREAGIPSRHIVVPGMLEPLRFQGVQLIPFEGQHWDRKDGVLHGVPAVGYLAEFNGRRWLFPGDTRTYDASRVPDFGPLEGLVAHLWLGRGCAQMAPPPLLEAFLAYCLALRPRRVLLTHLNEFGRDPSDFWERHHAEGVCRAFARLDASLSVTPALMGESAIL